MIEDMTASPSVDPGDALALYDSATYVAGVPYDAIDRLRARGSVRAGGFHADAAYAPNQRTSGPG